MDDFDPKLCAPKTIPMLDFEPAHPKADLSYPIRAAMRMASAYHGSFSDQGQRQAALDKMFMERPNPLTGRSESGDTFLHELARRWSGSDQDLNHILDKARKAGAAIDAPNRARRTPLHVAAFLGNAVVVAALLNAGHAVDPYDISGDTPLFDAAASGSLDCFELLAGAGAQIRWRNSAGEAAWARAQARGKEPLARRMLAMIEELEIQQVAQNARGASSAARL